MLDTGTTHVLRRMPGSELTDLPAPLFQLLVLAQLLSARIGAGIADRGRPRAGRGRMDDPPTHARRPAAPCGRALGRAGYRPLRRADPRPSSARWPCWFSIGTPVTCAGWPGRPTETSTGRPGLRAGGERDRPDGCRRLPAGGAGPCGRGSARTWTTGRWRVRAGSRLPDDVERLGELVRPPRAGPLRRRPRPGCPGSRLLRFRSTTCVGCDELTLPPIPGGKQWQQTEWPPHRAVPRCCPGRRQRPAGSRPLPRRAAAARGRRLGRPRRLPGRCDGRGPTASCPRPVAPQRVRDGRWTWHGRGKTGAPCPVPRTA